MSFLPSSAVRESALIPLALLFSLAAVLLAGTPRSASAQQNTIDRIAAVVGDDIILASEVDQSVRQRTRRGQRSYSDDLWMETLQQLIDQKILTEKAQRDTTITLSKQQVSKQLDRRIDQMVERAGSKERLEQAFGKSVLEIKEQFRDSFRRQLLAQRLRQKRSQKINITPSEVQRWYEDTPTDSLPNLPETVRLAHVVRYPEPSENVKEETRTLITALRDSIVSGDASFEEMAQQYSDDASTASSGGKLGPVNPDQLVPEFAAVASQTPEGDVSQAFYNESQDGFHILRVNEKSGSTINLNHILIKVNSNQSGAERAKAFLASIRDSVVSHGKSFAVMARRHSQEDRSSSNGGRVTDPNTGSRDLVLEDLNPSWRRTIRDIDTGEISQPTEVKLLNGDQAYHIVRLDKRTPPHTANLDQDYERIRRLAKQEKRQNKLEQWIDRLRDEVYVDVRIQKEDLSDLRSAR